MSFHFENKHLLKPLVWFPLMFLDSIDFSGLSTGSAVLQAVVMIRPDPAWFHTASCSDSTTLLLWAAGHPEALSSSSAILCPATPNTTKGSGQPHQPNRKVSPVNPNMGSAVNPANLSVVRDNEHIQTKLVWNPLLQSFIWLRVTCCLLFTFIATWWLKRWCRGNIWLQNIKFIIQRDFLKQKKKTGSKTNGTDGVYILSYIITLPTYNWKVAEGTKVHHISS